MHRSTIIAEAGINHNGDLSRALKLVHLAKNSGADVVKFQTFLPSIFKDDDPDRSLLKYSLPLEEFKVISNECEKVGIKFLSTPECVESLNYLIDECQMKAVKIGSGDITNFSLLRAAGKRNLPIYLSTGMSDVDDIWNAINAIGHYDITVLHCVSCYPTKPFEANLGAILTLRRVFAHYGVGIGYSDHTIGTVAPAIAAAMGADIIEKHFTDDSSLNGPDHWMSLTPLSFGLMVSKIREAEVLIGDGSKRVNDRELELRKRVRKGPDGKRLGPPNVN